MNLNSNFSIYLPISIDQDDIMLIHNVIEDRYSLSTLLLAVASFPTGRCTFFQDSSQYQQKTQLTLELLI